MLLRLPWLLSRKRLLAAVVIDSDLFSIFYFLAFRLRFGTMPGFSLPLGCLVPFWLLSSYVIGRYHVASPSDARIDATPLAERFDNTRRVQRPAPDRQGNHRPMKEAVIALAGAWLT